MARASKAKWSRIAPCLRHHESITVNLVVCLALVTKASVQEYTYCKTFHVEQRNMIQEFKEHDSRYKRHGSREMLQGSRYKKQGSRCLFHVEH